MKSIHGCQDLDIRKRDNLALKNVPFQSRKNTEQIGTYEGRIQTAAGG